MFGFGLISIDDADSFICMDLNKLGHASMFECHFKSNQWYFVPGARWYTCFDKLYLDLKWNTFMIFFDTEKLMVRSAHGMRCICGYSCLVWAHVCWIVYSMNKCLHRSWVAGQCSFRSANEEWIDAIRLDVMCERCQIAEEYFWCKDVRRSDDNLPIFHGSCYLVCTPHFGVAQSTDDEYN